MASGLRYPVDTGGTNASTGSVDAFAILSPPRRVAVLAALARTDGPVETGELARLVAAGESEKSVADVAERERRMIAISLRHHHLPALASHRIVEWDRTSDVVALGDGVSAERVRELVDDRSTAASSRLLGRLSQSRRRLVLAVLQEGERARSVDELARHVAAREHATNPADVSATAVDRVRVSLHHSHLAALSAVGLVEYDSAEDVVTARTS
ncbi:hypothetical protein [Halovivax sp.]|uniref:DUF7344 domain-containing protein n=1 Tax=Halovivax sp. TaxID=1935978 RepID=UPI0025BC723C|nr:hypothetical protein [Halovivax sp.]